MVRFLNRGPEIQVLDRLWQSRSAEFLVLYGRRRIGKTELLTRFADGRRSLFYEATDVRLEDQLADFGAVYAEALGLSSLAPQVRSWEHALEMVAEAARAERTLVVLDEFQYLAKQSPGLGSVLSRWWRDTGRQLELVFVLSGSDIAFFSDQVLGANAPLHGRRTADVRLRPFSPRDAALFIPSWSPDDRVRAYAVWGGVPYYLSFVDDGAMLSENILTTILQPGAPLLSEAEYLIRMESRLRDVALYGSILRAIADGRATASEIADRLHLDLGNLSKQIDRLEAVGLVTPLRPIVRARRTDVAWRIADPFLRFWFRFVAPAGARLASDQSAQRYLERTILPRLDEFVSAPSFEEICQWHLREDADAAAVGRWWGPLQERHRETDSLRTVEREADAVAVDDAGRVIALATCKWTNEPVNISEVNKLRRIAAYLEPENPAALYVYHRSGVDERILSEDVKVVPVEDLYNDSAGRVAPS